MRRTLTTLAVAALAMGWTTACEPPPPPASFTVNVAPGVTGDDADPGDGVCETAPGNGQCTLDAAVQEGNALGRADIHLPPAPDYDQQQLLTEPTVTGHLTFRTGDPIALEFAVRATDLHIATGGRLTLEGSDVFVERTTVIDGALLVDRSFFGSYVEVSAGGLFTMLNSYGGFWSSEPPEPDTPWMSNHGTAIIRFSTLIHGFGDGPRPALLHTHEEAVTRLGAVDVVWYRMTDEPDCTGETPLSDGYNTLVGCGLGGPGDVNLFDLGTHRLIPPGHLGCGTTVTVDREGNPRPAPDANPAGHCDRGALE